MFPKVPDYHKPNKPLVPNGLGIIYVLASVTYLFLLEYFYPTSDSISAALTLAVCILFGGLMGLLDDWMDLRWRYKAFFPLIASIPLVTLATRLALRTSLSLFFVTVQFGIYYYFIILPLIVTVTTNTVNQLGGLNGLETICPAIILIGLATISGGRAIMLYLPLAVWLVLAFFNFRGKIFVGNVGSFGIGMTLSAFAVISDLKFVMLIALLPYVFNSVVILLTYFFKRTKAKVDFDGHRLSSDHRRSLITIMTYHRPMTESRTVALISLLFVVSTTVAVVVHLLGT